MTCESVWGGVGVGRNQNDEEEIRKLLHHKKDCVWKSNTICNALLQTAYRQKTSVSESVWGTLQLCCSYSHITNRCDNTWGCDNTYTPRSCKTHTHTHLGLFSREQRAKHQCTLLAMLVSRASIHSDLPELGMPTVTKFCDYSYVARPESASGWCPHCGEIGLGLF